MAAPLGNEYWKKRKVSGRTKIIKTAQELWELACDYFQRCDDNPWHRTDFKGKDAQKVLIPTARPYTWSGFNDYCFERVGLTKLEHYKVNLDGRYKEFVDVIARINNIMITQKMEGAIVGAFNPNIIARDLGLTERRDYEVRTPEPIRFVPAKKRDDEKN